MKIIFEQTELEVSTLGYTSFSDFNEWIRCRFDISSEDKLIFKDKTGSEIIPCSTADKTISDVYAEINITRIDRSQVQGSDEQKPSNKSYYWVLFINIIPTMIVILLAVSLSSKNYFHGNYNTSKIIHLILGSTGLSEAWQYSMVEAFVAFVSWSNSYLFIRKSCNPETSGGALQKYALDAFFGGCAAFVAVILKHAMYASLKK
mmetsp:Transcript_26229/g.26472  ORF Transcript_26229/g.26472 Transcript_26229/m.26472 type:complete len:204 (-) Transcript_26229:203-814(-)